MGKATVPPLRARATGGHRVDHDRPRIATVDRADIDDSADAAGIEPGGHAVDPHHAGIDRAGVG